MTVTTADATAGDDEAKLDPRALARSVVLSVADEPEEVGDFVQSIDLGDNVTDFRFEALRKGYEGWQWAVTLYHDVDRDTWSVNESTLVSTKDSLLAPAWIPWKDRLEASDLSVTDSLGTDPDDPRMEDGFRKTEAVGSEDSSVAEDDAKSSGTSAGIDGSDDGASSAENADGSKNAKDGTENATEDGQNAVDGAESENVPTQEKHPEDDQIDPETGISTELEDTVEEFALSRRHVMSELGRSQTAKRWYEGQHGPKSLSTKTAEGNLCSTCAFFIGLKGDLDTMFGVCANRWSPDDGRVVSLDHGCGEHSEIEQPEPSHLWVQSKPAFDDLHIDIIAQAPREERGQVELIESIDDEDESDDSDDDTATETDIAEHAVPGSFDDDDDDDSDDDNEQDTVSSTVTAEVAVESTIDLSDDDDDDSTDDDSDDESDSDSDDDGIEQASEDESDDDGPDDADDTETDGESKTPDSAEDLAGTEPVADGDADETATQSHDGTAQVPRDDTDEDSPESA